jgi:lipoyl-dependent peroxiredoxin
MAVSRFAEVTWSGDLANGAGSINYVSSGAFARMPVSWVSRSEAHNGLTSPEELIASAHAACYAMSLGRRLARAGTPSTKLDVKAVVTFDMVDGGWRITRSDLTVRGRVPGIDAATFEANAQAAKDGCPVSQALKGNVEISLDAALVE